MSLLLLLLVAVGGYGGWMWWQGRKAPAAVVMPRHTPPKLRNAGVPPAGPAASSPPITNTANTATPTTTTITPISVAPAPQTTSAKPIPVPVAPPVANPVPAKPIVVKPAPVTTSMATHLERTNGAATITNTPQPATTASSDPIRAKYDGMARDFAAQTGGSHTLQFELVCETSSITRAMAEAGDKVWFVPMSYRGRPCYRVFWGRFNSSADATAATSQFPAALGVKPVVVKIPR